MPVAVPLMAMRRPSPQLRRTIVRGVPASALAWLWPARLCSTWVLCVEGELRFGARNGFGMIRREVRSLSQWSRVRRRSWHESPTPVPWRDRPSDGRCIARCFAWARGRMANRHSCPRPIGCRTARRRQPVEGRGRIGRVGGTPCPTKRPRHLSPLQATST